MTCPPRTSEMSARLPASRALQTGAVGAMMSRRHGDEGASDAPCQLPPGARVMGRPDRPDRRVRDCPHLVCEHRGLSSALPCQAVSCLRGRARVRGWHRVVLRNRDSSPLRAMSIMWPAPRSIAHRLSTELLSLPPVRCDMDVPVPQGCYWIVRHQPTSEEQHASV